MLLVSVGNGLSLGGPMEILLAMKRISLKDRITNICSIPAPNKNI